MRRKGRATIGAHSEFHHLEVYTMFTRILVPTDGSDITSKAVSTALGLAKSSGGQLFVISVKEPFPYSAISEMQPVPPQEFYDAQERIAATRVKSVVDAARAAGVACSGHTVEALHPWEAILDHAKAQQCDLIVMASHGRRGVAALLLGSETQRVLIHSTLPVLTVK
jgi:nucleotide-binding universal stress UspA family protein